MGLILINDGIHPSGKRLLEEAGHTVTTDRIDQSDLPNELPTYDGICVRSATKVRQELIELCPNLKFIGRGGVGLDNIDVEFAKSKGIKVLNTPSASSRSVAELTFAHIFSVLRFIYKSNKEMPESGSSDFKGLKKSYSKGLEIEGKRLGVIGFGRIGQEVAKMGLGLGMEIIPVDSYIKNDVTITNKIGNQHVSTTLSIAAMDDMLAQADIITLHIPGGDNPVLTKTEFAKMKDGVVIINTSRGGTIAEEDLLEALDHGKVAAAGLDVYENEPTPRASIMSHPKISMTPHIGASTGEAQEKIGIELAQQIIEVLG